MFACYLVHGVNENGQGVAYKIDNRVGLRKRTRPQTCLVADNDIHKSAIQSDGGLKRTFSAIDDNASCRTCQR
jgi:hypothetical protein